ncbi:sigma-70 family RNA polymerase sigma factor [Pseudomonas sp. SL4(2022)]|uniref:RNA polymerase sigma factor n=1 Tax=Pseudomonas sp. SL4(2022) TaxID=2994661 RepID=UPI002270B94C|nr:sigma-70 family RNA polymerase sigma factor [Pseudomonas sp. SL4(2022)]WAC44319.1 sigma-70 family RNA polymerase sigma factor [Pseudomonas sp. SL4(2022)]
MDEQFHGSISLAYRTLHAELLKFLGKRLGSAADAADLAQDAFTHWLCWRERSTVQQPRAFLFQIARNLLRDHWRRQQAQAPFNDDAATGQSLDTLVDQQGVSPLETIEQRQRLQMLALALDELSPRRREAFVLHRFEGLSQAEVAERMGISLSMVEKHIASALLHCKRRVEGCGAEVVP